jgi:hypothetical protein
VTEKRDADYYLKRIEREFPTIYADHRAGRIRSVRQAAIRAGLVKVPSGLVVLKREWKKASIRDQKAFLRWLLEKKKPLRPKIVIVDPSNRLTHPASAFLHKWRKDHKVSAGKIMKEMGYKGFDYRLATALKGAPLPADVVTSLSEWLSRNGFK